MIGKNVGMKKRVYKDDKGKKYYVAGTPGSGDTRRLYLEPYIDSAGIQRSANASGVILRQYETMYGNLPQVLFPVDPNVFIESLETEGEEKVGPG